MISRGFVLDASVAIKMVLTETGTERAVGLIGERLLAPDLLLPECANIIWKAVRRGEINEEAGELASATLLSLPFALTEGRDLLLGAVEFAIALRHPAYDCFYLELAAREKLPLVTADRRLLGLKIRDVKVVALDDLP